FLGYVAGGPGWHMDDAYAWMPLDDFGEVSGILASEDVDVMLLLCQLAGYMCDIHILPAAVDAAGAAERRGMLAHERNGLHGSYPGVVRPVAADAERAIVYSRMCSCRCEKHRNMGCVGPDDERDVCFLHGVVRFCWTAKKQVVFGRAREFAVVGIPARGV